jgi:hypothetical protein
MDLAGVASDTDDALDLADRTLAGSGAAFVADVVAATLPAGVRGVAVAHQGFESRLEAVADLTPVFHDLFFVGHAGTQRSQAKISRPLFWWRTISRPGIAGRFAQNPQGRIFVERGVGAPG